jgi:hypothetical protein
LWDDISPAFLLRPDWVRSSRRNPVPAVLALFGIGLVGAWVLGVLQVQIIDLLNFESRLDAELDDLSALQQVIFVAVLAPLIEELAYRLPLMRRLVMPLLMLSFVIIGLVYWIPALLGVLFLAVIAATQPLRESFAAWWERNPRWPIYASMATFGMLHMVNFDAAWTPLAIVLAPLVVGPQLWLGLMFTIGRVRFGWWTGVALHALHNFVVWALVFAVLE